MIDKHKRIDDIHNDGCNFMTATSHNQDDGTYQVISAIHASLPIMKLFLHMLGHWLSYWIGFFFWWTLTFLDLSSSDHYGLLAVIQVPPACNGNPNSYWVALAMAKLSPQRSDEEKHYFCCFELFWVAWVDQWGNSHG